MSSGAYNGSQSRLRVRLAAYVRSVLRRAPWYALDVKVLSRRLECSERSLWYAVASLRSLETLGFVISRKRLGSSYVTIFSRIPDPECKPLTIGQGFPIGKINSNTSASAGEQNSEVALLPTERKRYRATPALERKAHWLVRTGLRRQHWDNCKVTFVYGAALRYAQAALQRGFVDWSIAKAYHLALEALHRTATDVGLMLQTPELMFEPSKVKGHALEILERSDPEQVRYRPAALA